MVSLGGKRLKHVRLAKLHLRRCETSNSKISRSTHLRTNAPMNRLKVTKSKSDVILNPGLSGNQFTPVQKPFDSMNTTMRLSKAKSR